MGGVYVVVLICSFSSPSVLVGCGGLIMGKAA